MSVPDPNFEFILKAKRPLTLYSENKQQIQQNKPSLKPQDVISSVSMQLKAIQSADSLKTVKCASKDLQKYKKSIFLSVNNLPDYEEVPKATTKFDTQCVSDTQLINIIEDAEIIDVHQGMTQEFETSFVHHTEKHSSEDDEKVDDDVCKVDDEREIEDILTVGSDKENMDKIHENITKEISGKKIETNIETVTSVSLISPILCSNNVVDKDTGINSLYSKNNENTQLEEYSLIFHDCIDIDDEMDKSIERPLSPIFMHKSVKSKSKTPSPLIFNLDKFEQFEKMAVPILEANDFKTAKQIINSQILDKELHIQMDEGILLNKREISSPVLQNSLKTEFKTLTVKDPNLDTDLEFIELDKATSEELINKIMNEDSKCKGESEILKDEILFSSDEEDFVQKSYQDLPFTCALETSFYDQSDVLDKTMYVGFQTASNKSIQIFTESFAQAKSILSGEITVTDLVNNCDNSVKNKTQNDDGNQVKMDLCDEETEFNLAQKEDEESTIQSNEVKTTNFEGFMTASKKVIKLSQKALARCKKVFQDIDLSDNFDTQIDEVAMERGVGSCSDVPAITHPPNKERNKDISVEDIQNIDDEIIQEFENIEMSLHEDKDTDRHTADIKFKSNHKEEELTKLKEVLKDTDFEEDLLDIDFKENSLKVNTQPKIIEDSKLSDTNFKGFKTASNKIINISKEALDITKNIFQDLGSTKFPDKSNKNGEEYPILIDSKQPSTSILSFVGFKTANNNDIKISEQALAKTKNIFKDIDRTEFPNNNKEDIIQENTQKEVHFDGPSTSKMTFVGFKTANNKDINISKEAVLKTKKIFEDIDAAVFKLPTEKNIDEQSENFVDINQPATSKSTFIGFRTANNKNIKISDTGLAKTKSIFKDIDSDDFKYPDKEKKFENESTNNATAINIRSFEGFKTANNKVIKISDTALGKTKDVFKEIDSDAFKFSPKKKIIENDDDERTLGVEMMDLDIPSTTATSFGGFTTANNKKINITNEALAKTKNIFQDIDAKNFMFPEKGNKDLEKGTSYESGIDYNQPNSKPGFMGFKTANNRNIIISDESLAKTKNIFKDIDATDLKYDEKNNTEKERDAKSVSESEIVDLNQPSTSKASFGGFRTGSNKKIHISEKSLALTKNIFKDIDSNDFAFPNKSERLLQDTVKEKNTSCLGVKDSIGSAANKTSFIGFKTANNKVIHISETALTKTRALLEDIDGTEFQVPEKVKADYPIIEREHKGLTVSNNTGTVTTKINDFDIPGTAVPQFKGFHTGNNKQIKVSDKALAESRKLLQDIDFNVDEKPEENVANIDIVHVNRDNAKDSNTDHKLIDGKSSPIFKGFQTANKKPVTISEEALAKSRRLFQDIEIIADDLEPDFHGFNTGNDDKDEVLQTALFETKKLFEDVTKRSGLQGFQTASDKMVVVSEDSLAKSRKLLQDFDKDVNLLQDIKKKTSNINFGAKTGSSHDVIVSEAVARSKRRFSEIDDSNANETVTKKDKINEDNITNIIDTQVLNNFEESLHTEDFHDSPIKSKRSGSPILSCPRAKKRKRFETPYSQKLPKVEMKKDQINTTKDTFKITFDENYKKDKRYTLKDVANSAREYNTKIDPYLLQFTFDNLLQFEFQKHRNELSNENMTIDFLKESFLNSVNSKLIPKGWLDNHIKLILWKLISYEIKFRSFVVSTKNVIDQLKHRYDKELYNARRPALRKIFEKDDVPSRTIVLCVVRVFVDGVSATSATTTNNLELLLTDGWYCIKATIDKMLAQLVCQGKIVVGSKIVTTGAELVNCEQGISPLEDTSAVRLKLSGNSTRRARWDARLGYHGNAAILSQLSSVKLDGGKVSKLRVFVTRVYPPLYVEKFEDGSTVTRSERLEHLHQMKNEAERQAVMEKIYEQVEKEFSDQESQDSEGLTELSKTRLCLDSGSQIAQVMKRSKDPAEFRAGLTTSQTHLLEHYTSKRQEHLLQDIQQKISDKIEKAGVCVNRNVVTLLKIRVAGVGGSGAEVTKGMMSIWKPPDAVLEIIKEGAWIDVMNVAPTAVRYSEIQISAGRQSIFNTSKFKEPENFKPYTKLLKRTCFTIKDLSQNPFTVTDYNEIDTVGFIFLIDPSIREFDSAKQPFQNVFLADADKNMICINFWGGLKKYGYQNVLDTGQVVSCVNLQKRAGNTRKSIPQYRVTEFSYFTKTPKNENARIIINELSKIFTSLDRRKFCEDCVVLKNNYAVIKNCTENISPYRFNNSDFNMSKNKMFIDSPLARPNKIDDNFNLTGLDFESTFKQTDTQNLSEEVLQRKKKVNEKIARLKMYGEPPPLSSIHIINRSKNASNSYKSPLNSNNNPSKIISQKTKSESAKPKSDSSVNVASVEESPEKCGNSNVADLVCSPALMNRTYVKNVNPVKINFDMEDNNDSNVDHFAEEFDGSPPLSLD